MGMSAAHCQGNVGEFQSVWRVVTLHYWVLLNICQCLAVLGTYVKSFSSHEAHRVALISIFLALSQTSIHCQTTDTGASASRGVPVYIRLFAGTHCTYPRREGQAELTWLVGCIPRWFTRLQTLTHPSTNRARR